jgi:phage repressor protein C with HTH and peptisase S24 domain
MNMNGLAGYFSAVTLQEKLKKLMRLQGLSSISLAKAVGMSDAHLRKVMSGAIRNPHTKIAKIAAVLGVTIEELTAEESTARDGVTIVSVDHDKPRPVRTVRVPIRAVVVGGYPGEPGQVRDGEEEYDLLASEWRPGRSVIRLFGNSMYPTYWDGDLLLVEKTDRLKDRQIGLLRVGSETTVKRYFRDKRGKIALKGDNPTFPPIIAEPDEIEILGRILHIVKGERE